MTSSSRQLEATIAAEAAQAEATADAQLQCRRCQPKRSSVYGLRLPDERIEQLRRLGEARGIEPSALVRQWVIEHLDETEHALGGERRAAEWERDVRRTTDRLRQLLDERPSTRAG